jgi:hypothetical protein
MKRHLQLGIVLSGVALIDPVEALAGNVRLTASQGFCQVQIREGNWADPDQNPVTFNGPMSSGQQYVGSEGNQVCYRRSNNPSDCSSGLTVSATCASHTISGTYDASIN